jgi:hypothetical protein
MPKLGNLGNQLLQAAQESDSSIATLITTQKQTIEQERKAKFQKILGKKATFPKQAQKKRIR